jgi:hypothetical protein
MMPPSRHTIDVRKIYDLVVLKLGLGSIEICLLFITLKGEKKTASRLKSLKLG